MERRQRVQIGIAAGCLVIGAGLLVWLVAVFGPARGREIVVDAGAKARAATMAAATKPATRPVTTRPTQKVFFAALDKNDHKTAMAMLADDPKLALVELPDHGYVTALHWAAVEGDIELVDQLLADGAKLDAIEDHHHGTPLEWASYGGQLAMVKFLLERGAVVDEDAINVAKEGIAGTLQVKVKKAVYVEILKRLEVAAAQPTTMRAATTEATGPTTR